jgi:hypothetical protein
VCQAGLDSVWLAIKETDFLADEVLVTAVAVDGLSEVCTPRLFAI